MRLEVELWTLCGTETAEVMPSSQAVLSAMADVIETRLKGAPPRAADSLAL